jgi:hypothetical protein
MQGRAGWGRAGWGRAGCGAAAAAACAALAVAACASGRPAAPSPGQSVARSSPAAVSATSPAQRALAARYLAIASAGNRRLETGFDRLDGQDRGDLSAAQADLRDIAATEHLFDQQLSGMAFPAGTEQAARSLVRVNQARAQLTIMAARSASLPQLRGYERQLTAANEPVEAAVRLIRRQLGLPPPDTS